MKLRLSRAAMASFVGASIAVGVLSGCSNGGPPVGPVANTSGPTAGAGQGASGFASSAGSVQNNSSSGTGSNSNGGGGTLPIQIPTNLPGAVSVGSLPGGFPLPPGSSTMDVVSADGQYSATVQVTDPTAAYNFWLGALPSAGYQVTGEHGLATVDGVTRAGINLSGHGFTADSGIAIVGSTATIGLSTEGSGGSGGGSNGGNGGNSGSNTTATGTTTITDAGVSETIPCNGTVSVEGNGDNITLTGTCGTVNVEGQADTVTVDAAGTVNMSGGNDQVTVHTGSPAVNKSGSNDIFNGS